MADAASTQTFVQRPSRTPYGLAAVAWLALIFYGSLVPFHFKHGLLDSDGGIIQSLIDFITAPRWEDSSAPNAVSSLGISTRFSDVALNLGLFLPLGLFLRLAAWKREWPALFQLLAALLGVAAASWLTECTQNLTADRVASLRDFCLNTAGGAAGAIPAVMLRRYGVTMIFDVYCCTSMWLFRAGQSLQKLRYNPLAMFLVVAANGGLIAFAYHQSKNVHAKAGQEVNLMPFSVHVARSWDVAFFQIGRSMIVYLLIGMLLSLQFLSLKQRKTIGLVVLGAALLAGVREVMLATGAHARADVTEPILAGVAVIATVGTVALLVRAVKSSCRRKQSVPVANDRRRIPHEYDANGQLLPPRRGTAADRKPGSAADRRPAAPGAQAVPATAGAIAGTQKA
ncbi:MAG: VanZ family protein [Planctomycetota bacterium]|nr:VanZ family protein [Planctomycetota bacterium]